MRHPALLAVLALATLLLAPTARAADGGKWEKDWQTYEERDKTAPPAPGTIAFVGSSSFVKWGGLVKDMEPLPVWNRAFGGSSTPDQLPALPRLILPHKPRIVVYYCGDNDLANPAAPFEGPVKGFSDFVAALRKDEPQARVVYVSIKPSPSRVASWPHALKANAAIKELCGKTPGLTYVDVAAPMLDQDGAPRPELFGPDRLHMKPEGYAIWTATLKPVLEQLWAQTQKDQKDPLAK